MFPQRRPRARSILHALVATAAATVVALTVGAAPAPAPAAAAATGTVDTAFGSDGTGSTIVPYGSTAGAAAVITQPDDKIVTGGQTTVDGQTKMIVTRMAPDGTLDPTFGDKGIVTVAINGGAGMDSGAAMALQRDGKIILAGVGNHTIYGPQAFAAVRLNPDGSLDGSFGKDGVTTVDIGGTQSIANAVAIQPDGKIDLAGTAYIDGHKEFAATRLNADGTLDTSFGDNGKTTLSPVGGAWGMGLQSDGKIVLAGQADYDNPDVKDAQQFMVARLNSDGTLDTSYGKSGIVMQPVGGTALGYGVAIQPDDKAVVTGIAWTYTNMNANVRLNTDGSVDTSYGDNGVAEVPDANGTNGIILDSQGKSLLPSVGPSVVRFTADGKADGSFGGGGIVNDPVGTGGGANGAALQSDGTIVLAGGATVDGQTEIFVSRIR